jgi:hypothetical protein
MQGGSKMKIKKAHRPGKTAKFASSTNQADLIDFPNEFYIHHASNLKSKRRSLMKAVAGK